MNGTRRRYRVLDRARLRWRLEMQEQPDELFLRRYRITVEEQPRNGYLVRKSFWSEALAVGSEQGVGRFLPRVRNARIEAVGIADPSAVGENEATYALYAPQRDKAAFWNTQRP